MKDYISKIKNFLISLKITDDKIDDDPFGGLKSLNKAKEEKRKKIIKRILIIVIIGPAIIWIAQVLIKTVFIIFEQNDETVITKKIKRENYKFEINDFTKWQDLTDQNVIDINKEIDKVSLSLENTKHAMNSKIDEVEKNIAGNLDDAKNEIINSINKSTDNKISNIKNDLESKLETLKISTKSEINSNIDKFNEKLQEIEKKGLNKISLPTLPPLKQDTIRHSPPINFVKKDNDNKIVEYEIIEEVIEVEPFAISTLSNFTEDNEDKKPSVPSFTLMPGFAKAVIVTGADVPTMEAKTTEPKPIWLSINSEALIANSETMQLQDCLLKTVATGSYVNGRANLRLSQLSCVMLDLDGNKYKVLQNIKGWVYGEDGKYGAKGRVVSQEGKIISKGIPLAALEGAIEMLSNTNENSIVPSINVNGGNDNPMGSFARATSSTTGKILSKFSEYYLKILENLNPYIEIKAKRIVTVAFDGGEIIKPKPFSAFDIDAFEEKAYEYNNDTEVKKDEDNI